MTALHRIFGYTTTLFAAGALARAATPATPAPTPVPAPTKEVALRGPEVVKLDWNTRALQAIDINGDGLNDLVVANNDRSSIDILYQLKPGAPLDALPRSVSVNRWEPVLEDAHFHRTSVTTGVTVFDLVVGDLNGDHRPDLVYTGDPQPLTIRYQQPDGTWDEKKITDAPTPLQVEGSLKIADLNGDGRNELLMLGQKELAIFYPDKKGELGAPERYALPDENCYGLEVCDVNGDGRPDIVYLCSTGRDIVRVRLQTAEHQFGPEQAYTIKPTRCTLQVLAPAKGKQGAAFAFAQDVTGQLEEFRLDPTPVAASEPSLRPRVFSPRPGNKTPLAYALGDFNGDGRTDVAVTDPDGAQVFIYLRQRDGGFTTAQHFPIPADARAIAAGDWNGDGRDELFFGSPKEQMVGVASFTNDGRLSYPQPLPITGRPLALAVGDFTGNHQPMLAVLREEKNKRFLELWKRKDNSAELARPPIELTNVKTDPRAIRLFDANQDGRLDIAVFTPLDAMRLFVQGDALAFNELSASPNFRRGLVDNLDASAFSLGDIDGDGKPEFIVSSSGFARALRVTKDELTVVDQFNARDPSAEISTALVLPVAGAKTPTLILYDKKGEQFQTLKANEQSLYQVVDTTPVGKIEVTGAEVRTNGTAGAEAFVFGKDRFWWLPVGRGDFTPATVSTHATDLPDVHYGDIIAGDLNNDGQAEIVCVDPDKNLIEILSRDNHGGWESKMHFKVFETDEHFQGRKGPQPEPRETIVADVTGDGKKDLILLVHDRILVYPQE